MRKASGVSAKPRAGLDRRNFCEQRELCVAAPDDIVAIPNRDEVQRRRPRQEDRLDDPEQATRRPRATTEGAKREVQPQQDEGDDDQGGKGSKGRGDLHRSAEAGDAAPKRNDRLAHGVGLLAHGERVPARQEDHGRSVVGALNGFDQISVDDDRMAVGTS